MPINIFISRPNTLDKKQNNTMNFLQELLKKKIWILEL